LRNSHDNFRALAFEALGLVDGADDATFAAAFAAGGTYNCTMDQTAYLSQECQAKFQSEIFPVYADASTEFGSIIVFGYTADETTKTNYMTNVTAFCSTDCGAEVADWDAHYNDGSDDEFCPYIIMYLMQLMVEDDRTNVPCLFSDENIFERISEITNEFADTQSIDCSNMTTCTSFGLKTYYHMFAASFFESEEEYEEASAFFAQFFAAFEVQCPVLASMDGVCEMADDDSSASGSSSAGSSSAGSSSAGSSESDSGSSSAGSSSAGGTNSGSVLSDGAASRSVWAVLLMVVASMMAFA